MNNEGFGYREFYIYLRMLKDVREKCAQIRESRALVGEIEEDVDSCSAFVYRELESLSNQGFADSERYHGLEELRAATDIASCRLEEVYYLVQDVLAKLDGFEEAFFKVKAPRAVVKE